MLYFLINFLFYTLFSNFWTFFLLNLCRHFTARTFGCVWQCKQEYWLGENKMWHAKQNIEEDSQFLKW